jgi:hypothetical protein
MQNHPLPLGRPLLWIPASQRMCPFLQLHLLHLEQELYVMPRCLQTYTNVFYRSAPLNTNKPPHAESLPSTRTPESAKARRPSNKLLLGRSVKAFRGHTALSLVQAANLLLLPLCQQFFKSIWVLRLRLPSPPISIAKFARFPDQSASNHLLDQYVCTACNHHKQFL